MAAPKVWRPSLDDVESISRGGPAKVRGTGSRNIPHRLNAEERELYLLAKQRGYLTVRGTAYRKERKGSPLANIFRQWCDARGAVCVVIEQATATTPGASGGSGSGAGDRVVVDLSPLRREDTEAVEALLLSTAAEMGLRAVGYGERAPDVLPFSILPPTEEEEEEFDLSRAAGASGDAKAQEEGRPQEPAAAMEGGEAAGPSPRCGGGGGPVDTEACAHLRRAVEEASAGVRKLKEGEGRTNSDPLVKAAVAELLRLKAELQAAEAPPPAPTPAPAAPQPGLAQEPPAASPAPASSPTSPAPYPRPTADQFSRLSIWQVRAVPMFFEGDRAAVKRFAAEAAKRAEEAVGAARRAVGEKARAAAQAVAA
ncbi:hypothetical protein HYH03_000269 [Edaphochlamys debaryana]|uniref:WHEP-TRS domain-containing protein n=1 Tax=Edaphochlamys debaryana TaxID=47281 RepID=A0A835YQ27_9CHLO|nr:hypothetical protein HYH03_000269 [Edaphochlamys debaryana]|eukprot:KAG2501769.1 hypothetical protein HYH03_000269 [Edaphochlamys debaryana]